MLDVDVGCDGTHNISHAKPDDQPTTSDIEHKDLLPLKDAESPVLLFCSCKTRCANKKMSVQVKSFMLWTLLPSR